MQGKCLPGLKLSSASSSSDRSASGSSSSLLTEEDTSGNPLPPEIIQIRKRNQRLEKKLMTGMENLKISNIQSSEETLKILETNPEDFLSLSINSNKEKDSESFKSLISKIIKLQTELESAKSHLKSAELHIYDEESQNISLKQTLKQFEGFHPDLKASCCGCQIC